MVHAVYQLIFRNKKYSNVASSNSSTGTTRSQKCKEICVIKKNVLVSLKSLYIFSLINLLLQVPVKGGIFFDLFPFYIISNRNLEILSLGESLNQAVKFAIGESIKDVFTLVRPPISFTWDEVSDVIKT